VEGNDPRRPAAPGHGPDGEKHGGDNTCLSVENQLHKQL
ncbi:MAG: hypothetical protein AVDCRST_MAG56-1294, partial [uncultured Cytophagales bacterium]